MKTTDNSPHPRIPLRMQIRNDFVERIRKGELPPGQRLAATRDVAREYGVALRTVSQAYQLLQADGLIDARRGVGTFVCHHEGDTTETEILLCIGSDFLSCTESSERDTWVAFEWLRGMMKGARDYHIHLTPISSADEFHPDHYDRSRLAVVLFDTDYEQNGFGPVADYALEHDLPLCGLQVTDPRIYSVYDSRTVGSEHATAHLLALGHRRIALLNTIVDDSPGKARSSSGQQRQGYLRAMNRADAEPIYLEALPPEREGPLPTHNALNALLARTPPPTAILCNNDVRAFIVLDFLKARGLRVPTDVSVVGYDNRPQSRHCTPLLTTVDARLAAQGEEAIVHLAARLSEERTHASRVIPRLIVRSSSGAPAH